MTAPAVTRADPKKLYIVIEPHVSADGIFRENDVVAGVHVDVQRRPQFYVAQGATTDEMFEAKQERFYARLGKG